MNHTTVINKISELGYKGFKEAYLRQMEDVNYHNLSFEDRLYQLLDAQDTFLNPLYPNSDILFITVVWFIFSFLFIIIL